jgi:hypothetical protein
MVVLPFATQIKHKSRTPTQDRSLKAEVTFCVQGVIGPPCGVPSSTGPTKPSSNTPALRKPRPWWRRSQDRFGRDSCRRARRRTPGRPILDGVHGARHRRPRRPAPVARGLMEAWFVPTLRWRGQSGANSSRRPTPPIKGQFHRRSDEFLESIKRGSKRPRRKQK